MRKKFTMLLASLFLVMGTAWAQVSYTVSMTTGAANSNGDYFNTWTNTATNANPIALKLTVGANNMHNESGALTLFVGGGSTYSLEVPATHRIVSYSFDFVRDDVKKPYEDNKTVTLAVGGQSFTINKTTPTEAQSVAVNNVNASSTSFRMTGDNFGIVVSNFVVNVERVFESGYYTIQCNGNNQFANYNGGERIVPMDMGRFPTSVYLITKGDNGMYTIQTSNKKYVTYNGTDGDAVKIVDAASANENNKWWVINETSAEVFTIVPKQDNIGADTPGWNYSVNFGGANGAVGFYKRSNGNSKWLIKAAPIMSSGTAKIKCADTYVTLGSEATLFTKGNADNACQFTVLAGEEGKYTIQLADGRFMTHKSSNNGDQIEIVEAGSATDDNKWWVIAPNVTGEKSTENEVDIIPAHGNGIGRGTAAWNWSVNTNANLGFWGASDPSSRCTIEWTPTTFTYSYSYNGQVKHTEQVQGFVGYPYPAPTLSVFGVVPAPIVGDIVAGDQGKTFDMEYTIDLPFQFADSYDNIEHWYFMKIRDDGFTYMGYDAAKSYIRANQSNVPVDSKDAYTWGFVGNPFDGFSIVNYATGKTKVLSAPVAPTGDKNADQLARMVEVTNEYTGNLVWNFLAPTHPNPRPGVFYIKHPTTNYAFNRQSYDGGNAVCYWTGRDTGSAVQVVERGVFNLSDLTNQGIYALQAERSPLLYDANVERPNKLSSGMANNITANTNDINQQFIIFSSKTDGAYYLYSLGASKFVDANLNFTDYPEPVLSFGSNANNSYYPWYVKINDKYVVPGSGGQDGNTLHHVPNPNEDDGKRYRIIKVGEDMSIATDVALTIQQADALIKDINSLSNEKVYTLYTRDRGEWYYNGDEALWSTGKTAKPADATADVDKFAFLTVNGKTYLYSVGARKFIVRSETEGSLKGEDVGFYYATYSDVPSQTVDLLPATNGGWFPVVVKFNVDGPNQVNITNECTYPLVFWNDQADAGNQVRVEVAEGTYDLSDVVTTIETYQINTEARGGLEALITEATTLLERLPEGLAEKQALSDAKEAAQAVLDQSEPAATYEQMMEKKESLVTALAAVQEYPFINGMLKELTAGSYLIYYTDGEGAKHYLKTNAANSVITVADNPEQYPMSYDVEVAGLNTAETKYQKAYTLKMNGLYISNTSKDASNIETKPNKNDWSTQAIFEKDGKCAIRLTNAIDNAQGWHGHWFIGKGDTEGTTIAKDPAVTALEDLFIWTIEQPTKDAVQIAADELRQYIESLPTDRNIAPGLNNYSQPKGDKDFNEAKAEVLAFCNAITRATTVEEINAKKEYLEDLESRITINMPENGKFYRVRCTASGMKYLQSTLDETNESDIRLKVLSGATGVDATFCYVDGALLSYTTGLYINAYRFNEVGVKSDVVFTGASNGKYGRYNIKVGDRWIYGAQTGGGNNKIDSGTGDKAGNEDGYTWWLEEVKNLPVTVTTAGWATLYAPVALTIPDGIEAVYTGTVVDNYLDLTAIEDGTIPANTGVVIKANEGTYNFTIVADVDEITDNDLTGKYPKSAKNANANAKVYTLQNGDNGVGFYLFKGQDANGATTYINGFRAWVELEANTPANALRIRFAGENHGGTTSLESSELKAQGSALIYDLQGRRVLNPTKGMYIVNGKKMVIK